MTLSCLLLYLLGSCLATVEFLPSISNFWTQMTFQVVLHFQMAIVHFHRGWQKWKKIKTSEKLL